MAVKKGDRFTWRVEDGDALLKTIHISVIRVAQDGTWADIHCSDRHQFWTKRQPLPFPDSFWPVAP